LPSFSRGSRVWTYASLEAVIACSGETSMNWERPVGLVAQAERANKAKSINSFFIAGPLVEDRFVQWTMSGNG
jgi:hypothetical protein